MSMFDRYDEQARSALRLARDSAIQLHSRMVGPEHILAGLLDSADPLLTTLLESLGAPVLSVRHELRNIIDPVLRGGYGSAEAPPDFRNEAKQVLLAAETEAGLGEVTVTHLLLRICSVIPLLSRRMCWRATALPMSGLAPCATRFAPLVAAHSPLRMRVVTNLRLRSISSVAISPQRPWRVR